MIASVGATLEQITGAEPPPDTYKMADHWWGMIIDIDKCIGCGNCVRACSNENQVPEGYFRTWVERYEVPEGNATRTSIRPTAPSTASRLPKHDRRQELLRAQALQPLRRFALRAGLPGGRHLRQPGRRGAGGQELLPGLPLLRAGLPLRLPLSASRDRDGGQVHPLLPPHHQGTDHGLLRELPHRRAAAGGFQESQGPGARIPARTTKSQVLKPHMATEAKVYYKNLDGSVR